MVRRTVSILLLLATCFFGIVWCLSYLTPVLPVDYPYVGGWASGRFMIQDGALTVRSNIVNQPPPLNMTQPLNLADMYVTPVLTLGGLRLE